MGLCASSPEGVGTAPFDLDVQIVATGDDRRNRLGQVIGCRMNDTLAALRRKIEEQLSEDIQGEFRFVTEGPGDKRIKWATAQENLKQVSAALTDGAGTSKTMIIEVDDRGPQQQRSQQPAQDEVHLVHMPPAKRSACFSPPRLGI